jgi:hypothetical protein
MRFPYHDFMRLVALKYVQNEDGWDNQNAWGMKKLAVLDSRRKPNQHDWSEAK